MNALRFLQEVSGLIGLLFLICYFYQLLYIPVALLGRKKERADAPPRRYAVLISARNEEAVIGRLLDSIRQQDYPADYVVPFVVADNCSDGHRPGGPGRRRGGLRADGPDPCGQGLRPGLSAGADPGRLGRRVF